MQINTGIPSLVVSKEEEAQVPSNVATQAALSKEEEETEESLIASVVSKSLQVSSDRPHSPRPLLAPTRHFYKHRTDAPSLKATTDASPSKVRTDVHSLTDAPSLKVKAKVHPFIDIPPFKVKADVHPQTTKEARPSSKEKSQTNQLILNPLFGKKYKSDSVYLKFQRELENEISTTKDDNPNDFFRGESEAVKAFREYVNKNCKEWLDVVLLSKKMNRKLDVLQKQYGHEKTKNRETRIKYGEKLFPAFVASLAEHLTHIDRGLLDELRKLRDAIKKKFTKTEAQSEVLVLGIVSLRVFVFHLIDAINNTYVDSEAIVRRGVVTGMLEYINGDLKELPKELEPLFQ